MIHTFAFWLIVSNFLAFGLGALFKFRNGHTTKVYSAFTLAWWASCLATLFVLATSQPVVAWIYQLGIVLALLSLALFFAALKAMWAKPFTLIFSSDVPRQIQFTGVYQIVRHPFYTSYMMNYVAAVLLSGSLVVAASSLAMCCIYVRAALDEEKKFANSELAILYRQYMMKTGRFVPYVLR